ncbi:phosphotransferase enzyme family protein [Mariannaea sp. PMI_226]|nr:phosphotransferase enzyme family protein [Mariannaea sp. PMI_226]
MSSHDDFRDEIIQSRVYCERDRFVASISERDILNLAKSVRDDDVDCQFFQPEIRGSFNVCYFVEFEDGVKWVVRIPLTPCLAFGSRNKLESEVATMKLVQEKTSIPVPSIINYKLGDDSTPLSSYLIIEYVEGEKLSFAQLKSFSADERKRFFSSLANVYLELRRLEFPAIGCLTEDFQVRKKPVTIAVNTQQLEGLGPSRVQDAFYGLGSLTSANEYTTMQLLIASNALVQSRNSVFELGVGREALYHQNLFHRFANAWVDRKLNTGPFVMVHGDLQPWNLILNEKREIVSVIDWEWSRIVPRQYFLPPLWLKPVDFTQLCLPPVYEDWMETFTDFLAEMKKLETARGGDIRLYREWREASKNGGFLVASALENWEDVEWVADRYIGHTQHGGAKDLAQRVKKFLEEDPTREEFLQKKMEEHAEYEVELGKLRQSDSHHPSCTCGGAGSRFIRFCTKPREISPTSLVLLVSTVAVAAASVAHWGFPSRG